MCGLFKQEIGGKSHFHGSAGRACIPDMELAKWNSWQMGSGSLISTLSLEEFVSLREADKGPLQRSIPAAHRNRLISLGYIVDLPGGLELTHAGHMRLALGD